MYGKILTAIEANSYDNFRKRAYISKTEKLLTLPFSYAKSLNPGEVNTVSVAVAPSLLSPRPRFSLSFAPQQQRFFGNIRHPFRFRWGPIELPR